MRKQEERFWLGADEATLGAALRALNGAEAALVRVGRDGRVIGMTAAAERLFGQMTLASFEIALGEDGARNLSACLERGSAQQYVEVIGDVQYKASFEPSGEGALLHFEPISSTTELMHLLSSRIRQSLSALMLSAENDAPAYRASLQIDRMLEHAELLSKGALPALQPVPFDLPAVCREVAEKTGERLSGPRVTVTGAERVMIFGDPQLMKTALYNLVVNAVQAGADTVMLELRASGDRILLRVVDDGAGLSPAQLRRLYTGWSEECDYETFVRRMQSGERTGLGLPVVHSIVRAHGGMIFYMRGERGRGSVFQLSLPTFRGRAPYVEVRSGKPYIARTIDPAALELSVLPIDFTGHRD